MEILALQDETLDHLCWRVLGRTAGVTEAALEMNPDSLTAILPEGTVVTLPDAPPAPARPLVNLWS